jgi:hypothetical protein
MRTYSTTLDNGTRVDVEIDSRSSPAAVRETVYAELLERLPPPRPAEKLVERDAAGQIVRVIERPADPSIPSTAAVVADAVARRFAEVEAKAIRGANRSRRRVDTRVARRGGEAGVES